MLENLDTIAWERLETTYGPATKVPRYLRDLASPNPEIWSTATWGLYTLLCYRQWTISSATAPAVPFLLELLSSPSVQCRVQILGLLGDIAGAHCYCYPRYRNLIPEEEWNTPEFHPEPDDEDEIIRRAHDAVWSGLDLYLQLLQDPDPIVRFTVSYTVGLLLYWCDDEESETTDRNTVYARIFHSFARRLEEETQETVQGSFMYPLTVKSDRYPDSIQFCRQWIAPTYSYQVRLPAAWCLVENIERPPREAVDLLIDATRNVYQVSRLFFWEPQHRFLFYWRCHPIYRTVMKEEEEVEDEEEYLENPLEELSVPVVSEVDIDSEFTNGRRNLSIGLLCGLHPRYASYLLPVFLDLIRSDNLHLAVDVSSPILNYLFQGNPLQHDTTVADLTPGQRKALQAVYDNLQFWLASYDNYELIHSLNIPKTRQELGDFLGIEDRQMTSQEIEDVLTMAVRQDLVLPNEVTPSEQDWLRVDSIQIRYMFSDAFCPLLARFPNLESLDICGSKMTDEGLSLLPDFLNLRKFDLSHTLVTNVGMVYLTRYPALEELNISNERITDAGLIHLYELKYLKRIILWGCNLSEQVIVGFQKAHPECIICK